MGAWRHPFADVHDETVEGTPRRITTLHPGLGTSDAALRQTGALNRILGALDDSRIAPADSAERFEERLRLIGPDVGGTPIGERIASGPLSVGAAVHVLVQVCEALESAHGLGVIHGAITPSAVLVYGEGDAPQIVVTDFGLGHVVGGAEHGDGDPSWQPVTPERLLGERPVPATDVYQLGALAYALLTGRPVFSGETAEVVQRSHSIEEAPALHDTDPSIPKTLSQIVARCLVKEPEDRFERPKAFGDALRDLADTFAANQDDDEPHTVIQRLRTPPGAEASATEPARRDVDEEAATRAMVLRKRPTAPPVDPAPPPPSRGWIAPVLIIGLLVAAGAGYVVYAQGSGGTAADKAPTDRPAVSTPASEAKSKPEVESPSENTPAQAGETDGSEPTEEPSAQGESNEPKVKSAAESQDELDEGEPLAPDDAAQFLEEGEVDGEAEGSEDGEKSEEGPKRTRETRAEARALVIKAAGERRAGRLDEAAELYKQALEVHLNYAPAAHGLAGIYYRKGEFEEALEYGQIAVASAPRSAEYHVRVGDAYQELGNRDKARFHWRRASRLGSKIADERLGI